MTPIQLYTYQTPNGHKASIMLEKTGLPYDVHVVDIEKGDQNSPEFLALNPINKIPVIIDPDRNRTVIESGAILLYLTERSGVLKARGEAEAGQTLQWMLFQAAHVGPTLGQLWNYKFFAPEKIVSVIERFEREAARVVRVLDNRLAVNRYLAGDRYGAADVMTWPWIHAAAAKIGVALDSYANLVRWLMMSRRGRPSNAAFLFRTSQNMRPPPERSIRPVLQHRREKMGAPSPELCNLWLARAFNAQDVDAAAAMYHPDASIVQVDEVHGGTTLARGAESIRKTMAAYVGLKPHMDVVTHHTTVAGDFAMTRSQWLIKGTDKDGKPTQVHHHGMEVHRRLPDGTWVFFMDHPFGADPSWAIEAPPHTE